MPSPKIMDTVSFRGDEYYTRREDAERIADHILKIPHLKVWCPFNDRNSVWADVLRERGFDVVATDGDFFTMTPPTDCQAIISNPPFSIKKEILDRIKQLNLRFVLILPFLWLNDGVPFEYGNQLMMFRKRMLVEFFGQCDTRARCYDDEIALIIEEMPTIDAQEVKHGKWVFVGTKTNMVSLSCHEIYKCNLCGRQNKCRYDYCPHCGARMEDK